MPAARRAARRAFCGSITRRGSFTDSSPAFSTPKRVRAEAVSSAAPLAAATTRLRPPRSVPMPPAIARRSAQVRSLPGVPVSSGSRSKGCIDSFIRCMLATSPATPAAARSRAGPASATGVVTIAAPPAARLAEEAKRYGRWPRPASQVGTTVLPSSAPVYEASSGARATWPREAGPSAARSRGRSAPSGSFSPARRSTSRAPSTPDSEAKPPTTQVPRLMGLVTLTVRIMFRNRSGRPRSSMSASVPTPTVPSAVRRALRRSTGRPVHCAPKASRPEPPATPPRNR